jgi:hypothetical protein
MESRKFSNRPDLREVMDFVIVNNSQHSEFDDFKRTMTDHHYSILSTNALLDYWNEYERNTTQSTIMVYGKRHHYTEMDQLCEWVLKEREKVIEGKDLAIEQTITDAKENNASSTINLCLTKEEVHVTPIMIDADNCAPSTSQWPTSWIPDLNITQADKDILTSSCAWLTDSIINERKSTGYWFTKC